MQWIVGIDGGGSKTAFSAMEIGSGKQVRMRSASICPQDHGLEGYGRILADAFCRMGISREDVAALCVGVPCFGEYEGADEQIRQQTHRLFPNAKLRCENDCYVGFAGAFGLEPGINVVSGTGAIAYGMDSQGNAARSNGWHPDFSDEGSGAWLGRACLGLFVKQADGREKPGRLLAIFRERLDICTEMDAIAYYQANCYNNRTELARMQEILLQAAREGDLSARRLYGQAAEELAASVRAVYEKLHFPGQVLVSYSGGVFRAGETLLGAFRELLSSKVPQSRLVEPRYAPEDGALLAAAALISFPKIIIREDKGRKND